MTPYERAEKLVARWNNSLGSGRDGLVSLITAALQAQSNEDEARHREQMAALRTLLAQQAQRADALAAQVAELRRALEPFARWAEQLDSPPNWVPDGCPLVASPGDVSDFSVGQLRAAHAALSSSPGDALERVRREAMERMVNVARGCHDYGGGYRGTDHFDAYQAGIATVVTALEHRIKDNADTQCNALEIMGRAAELRKGGRG